MKRLVRVLGILLALAGCAVVIAWPALAQEPIYVTEVEPPEGLPGQELHLTVRGSGFNELREAGVWLVIADMEVFSVQIESDGAILADVSIPDNAPPGPRPVEVVVLGREGEVVARLDEGFFVLEQGPQSAPFVDRVEPQQVQQGGQLELNVFGRGFAPGARVEIDGEGISVDGVEFISPEHLLAVTDVAEGAPTGWRAVRVINPDEQTGERQRALEVVGMGEAPLLVDGVEPQQVPQGSRVELNVFGRGFAPGARVEIDGEGVSVDGVEFISPEHLLAVTDVAEGAPTGWRAVVVINPDGQTGESQRALEVVGEAPPPGPSVTSAPPAAPTPAPTPPPEDGTPLWPWAGGAVVALGAGAAIGRALTLRTQLTWKRTAQAQWQVEAETKLPDAKKICTWACKAKVSADMLKGWQVTGLELTPYPQPGGKTPPVKRIVGQVLDSLTEAAQPLHIAEGEAETRQRVSQAAEALLDQILAWEGEGQTPASIRVDARLSRDIKSQFKLYHCEQVGAKPDWVDSGIKWTGTLHRPGGKCLGVLRGPTAGEPDFAGRARQELEDLLVQLIRSVRFKV
jgi:hypothetical protein